MIEVEIFLLLINNIDGGALNFFMNNISIDATYEVIQYSMINFYNSDARKIQDKLEL